MNTWPGAARPGLSRRTARVITVLLLLLPPAWSAFSLRAAAASGGVVAWGDNRVGLTQVPTAAQSGVLAVAAGYQHALALKQDGSVVAWGDNRYGQANVPGAAQAGVRAISAGSGHSVALMEDGSVVAWGADDYGQVTPPVEAQSSVSAISAGGVHTVALKAGSVLAWGDNSQGQTTVPPEALSGVTAIAAGYGHTLALKSNGAVVAWGYNSHGQTIVPVAAHTNVIAVAAGYRHSMALKSDGAVVAWGDDTYGQSWIPFDARSGVVAIAAGYRHSVALRTNGQVLAWGDNSQGQTSVPWGLSSPVSIAATSAGTLALVPHAAPSIVKQPASLSVLVGQTAYFSVEARGYPLHYQWRYNGESIPGATLSSLTLENVSVYHRGDYSVLVTNYLGAVTSDTAKLSVIYYAPTGHVFLAAGSLPAPAGSFVRLCADISAAPSPTLQWLFNGEPLPGQTYSCLEFSSIFTNRAGNYSVVASNLVGVFTTEPFAVDVACYAPQGSISPSGVLPPVLAGQGVTLCSLIEAAPPASYQWLFNDIALPGQNNSCLTLSNLLPDQSGPYRLVATNMFGAFTSEVAVVSVVYAPPAASIYINGGRLPATVGESLTLCASVWGGPPPTLQWQFGGVDLPGQTNSCFYLQNLQITNNGNYAVVARNPVGVVTSAVAVVTVLQEAPVLACFVREFPPWMVGSYQTLYARVSLPEPAKVQWRLNGTNLLGEIYPWLTISPVKAGDAGDYSVVATTVSGSYTSPPIAVALYWAPPSQATPYFVLGGPSALTGTDVSLTASYAGSPSSVQWRFNGEELQEQTNSFLALLAITESQAGKYSFVASNVAGMTTSSVATVSLHYAPPQFSVNPASQSVVEGGAVRLQAYAPAGPPPDYFLLHNGTNVPVPFTFEGWGEGSGGFTLLETSLADAGNYWIIASNFLGAATSSVATVGITAAGPLDRWSQRNPLPQSYPLLALARGTNLWVGVGERGAIVTSPDGVSWALQSRRADVPLRAVAYGGGVFVAVGDWGTILSSPDGTNWSYRYTASGTYLGGVTYAKGKFVAVGGAPAFSTLVMCSTDGITWERVPLSGFQAGQCVIWANDLFLAAGDTAIIGSRDATNWTVVQNVPGRIQSLTYGAGHYVAVGEGGSIYVSSDGGSWLSAGSGGARRLIDVAFGGDRFVAVGTRGTMLTSTDASAWTPADSSTPDRLEAITYAPGLFVAAGENGTIITSDTGTNWMKRNFGSTRDLDGMDVANATVVVVGKAGTVLTSTDGTHYTGQDSGVTNDLHGVAWGGGLWVAVGEQGTVLTSSNAVDWVSHISGNTNSLKSALYANGQWLAVGTQGTVVRSTDATTWQTICLWPEFDLNDVAFGNGVYLIAGDGAYSRNGSILESADGSTWNWLPVSPGKNLRGVAFLEGAFHFVGNDGTLLEYSGVPPISLGWLTLPAGNLRALTRTSGLWVAVGNNGAIFTSEDRIAWTRRFSRNLENLHRVACFDGKLIAIGNRGTILQSQTFLTQLEQPRYLEGTGVELPFKGVFNRVYQLQATSDLQNWATIATFTNVSERATLRDADAIRHQRRFYRLSTP